MGVVTSSFVKEAAQVDGRCWVRETHTDHLGRVQVITWLCPIGGDASARLAANAAAIDATATETETGANVATVRTNGSTAVLVFNYSTIAQNRTALRSAYSLATRHEAIMLGDFMAALTDTQLQALFGLTAAQVTTLRSAKLTPAASAATTLRTVTGA